MVSTIACYCNLTIAVTYVYAHQRLMLLKFPVDHDFVHV